MQVKIEPIVLAGGRTVVYEESRAVYVPALIEASITDASWNVEFKILNVSEYETPVVCELHIVMRPGGAPITADMVRGIRLGHAVRQAIGLASTLLEPTDDPETFNWVEGAGNAKSTKKVMTKPRATVSVDEVKRVAELYRQIKADPSRRDSIMGVAKELHLTRATAHRRIQRARKLGLLAEGE